MKPKAPKKKDTKPSAKSGDKVRESSGGIVWNNCYIGNDGFVYFRHKWVKIKIKD